MNQKLLEFPAFIGRYLLTLEVTDILDIAIMVFVMYHLFLLVRSTKAASLLKGLLVFLAALALSSVLHLNGINFIMSRMVDWGVLALIILFQPEIRRSCRQHGANHSPDRIGLHGDVSVPYRCADRF